MKHITYHTSHNQYKIMIRRGKQFFNMETKSLAEAEKIRDKVLVYYDEHKSLPTRQQIGLENGRQGGTGLYRVKPKRSINDKCTKCGEEVSYKSKAAYQRFLDADKECLSCRRADGKKKSWVNLSCLTSLSMNLEALNLTEFLYSEKASCFISISIL